MKKIIIAFVSLLPLLGISQTKNQGIKISGQIKNVMDTIDWIFLSYYDYENSKRITDSAKVTDGGIYHFNLKNNEPLAVSLRARNSAGLLKRPAKKDFASVYLQPGNITIESVDSFSNVKVTGSKAHIEFEKLNVLSKSYEDQMQEVYKKYSEAKKEGKLEEAAKFDAQADSINDKLGEEVYLKYAKTNPNSPLALYALQRFNIYGINVAKTVPVFNKFSEAVQKSSSGLLFKKKIDIAKKTSIGELALEFSQNDTLGKPVSLSSFKGKYVLLDFWASWCGPCRAENPNVVKVFNKYKDKNFTILSVSLDQPDGKDRWIQAIHDDKLTWTHVSDLQFWANAVAKQYDIQSIPANLLIDPKGKIIAKNLRGDKLEEQLQGLIGK
jgi:peroxiredoxin